MGLPKGTRLLFSLNQHCLQWARIYSKFYFSSPKDGLALGLGILSVVSWGVAEVPQLITSYKEKSTEGLSVAFLMTWIVGDLFNLIGCWLEPATLPTQFYMALLYTATTAFLTAQTVYYGHIYHHLKAKKISIWFKSKEPIQEDNLGKEKLTAYNTGDMESRESVYEADISSSAATTSPIPVSAPLSRRTDSTGRDLYYISARSLSNSPIPTIGSWLSHSRDSYRKSSIIADNQHSSREALLGRLVPTQSEPPLNIKNTLCVVSSAAFFVGIYGLHLSMTNIFLAPPPGMVILIGRRLLQEDMFVDSSIQEASSNSRIGSILGWAMTVIYLSGRLPQICLNIRRGNVKGLNPLMFLFALIGNSTYVGSILVKSLEWSKIRPNLPWLVDAGGCVLLDAFILIQFVYFHYRKLEDSERRNLHYDLA